MPKFLYTVTLLTLISWGLVIYMVGAVSPDAYLQIFTFLFLLFIALSFSLSLFIYTLLKKKKPEFLKDNVLYKKSFKYGSYTSFGLTGVALMKAFDILTLLNAGLFMLLYLGIFYQLKDKK